MTALMAAVLGDHTEVVQFLLNNGADLSCIRVSAITFSMLHVGGLCSFGLLVHLFFLPVGPLYYQWEHSP